MASDSPSPTATPADVARHYDELDEFYRDLWGDHVHHGLWEPGRRDSVEAATGRLVELVAARAALVPGARVCDVGCGYGATARALAADHGCEVVGVTVSPVQHARAVAEAAPGCRFVLGDWPEVARGWAAGAAASFDAVIAIESTAHMADKPAAVRAMAEALRRGGRAVICAWLAGDAVAGWRRARLLEPICREGRLPGMGTEAEYGRWLEEAGLEPERFEDLSERVRGTWGVVVRRTAAALLTRPRYARYLMRANASERAFGLAVGRIWLAYRVGALRYGVFTARKP